MDSDSDLSDQSGGGEDAMEAMALDRIKGKTVSECRYDVDALEQSVQDLATGFLTGVDAEEDRPFEELLAVSAPDDLGLGKEEYHDDLRRETAFFDATRDAVTEALSKCDNLGIKHRRPKDFYAEMVKSDEHMQRVKQRILSQKKRIEEAEERRRKRDMRKFGKQTQIEKQQERSKGKKEELNLIKKLRKGGAGEHTTGEIDAMLEGKRGAPGRGRKDAGEKRTNKKRELKNKKYGFGGRKRPMKTNDAKSASDMSSFSIRKNKQLPPGVSPKSGPNKSIQKRPGKMKRHQQRVKR